MGESYTSTNEVTIGEIENMITVTVSVISITAVIVGYAGVAAFTGAAKSKVSKCAASIKALIDVAANDDVVTMTFRYKCKEVWESDPSYSDGGFWFLGYVTDSSYFKYTIN